MGFFLYSYGAVYYIFSEDNNFSWFPYLYLGFNFSVLSIGFLILSSNLNTENINFIPQKKIIHKFLWSLLYLLIFIKIIIFLMDLPGGLYFSGSRVRTAPLWLSSIVDYFFVAALILVELLSTSSFNKISLFVLFFLERAATTMLIDGSRRGLLIAILPIIFYLWNLRLFRKEREFYWKLILVSSIGCFFMFLQMWQVVRAGGDISFLINFKDTDFNFIYEAAAMVFEYDFSNGTHDGITYIKPILFGLSSLFFDPKPPVSVFTANIIYGIPAMDMTINPGIFGEAIINFGQQLAAISFVFLAIYLVYIKYVNEITFPSYIAISQLMGSLFLIWRGQFEQCFYLALPPLMCVFALCLFARFRKGSTIKAYANT